MHYGILTQMSPEKYLSFRLWRTDASFRQVSSAISSTLLNLGGFIFWMSSLLTVIFFALSISSTSTSSPRSSLMLADSKPCFSDGIHTSFLDDQSAWATGLLMKSLSVKRNFSSSLRVFFVILVLGQDNQNLREKKIFKQSFL